MGAKMQKPPVTEKMMRKALSDQDVSLFAHQPPVHFKNKPSTGHRFLFTREVTWPGSSEQNQVHMGIYLHGADGWVSHNLFTSWHIMLSDTRNPSRFYQDPQDIFNYGVATNRERGLFLTYEMGWRTDANNATFWDSAFNDPYNQSSFTRMVGAHHPPPQDLVPTGNRYGGKGVGFNHLIPEIARTWRVWQEWLVTASVMSLAD